MRGGTSKLALHEVAVRKLQPHKGGKRNTFKDFRATTRLGPQRDGLRSEAAEERQYFSAGSAVPNPKRTDEEAEGGSPA